MDFDFERWFVVRMKMRADNGDVDYEKKEVYSEADAWNAYYTWKGAAYVDVTYPYISIIAYDCSSHVLENCCIKTKYVSTTTDNSTSEES